MIVFEDALKTVLGSVQDFGYERVSLKESHNRVLAENVYADRDFPPFDRVTKDGIAINFDAYIAGNKEFKIQETAAAGSPQKKLENVNSCIEVMTGAMLPKNTDTVVMYEHLSIYNGIATIDNPPLKGQDIHSQGIDKETGSLLLSENSRINAAEIGVLASVGKHIVLVKRLPKIAIVSTGDELVNIDEMPKPHQIRKSNSFSIQAALRVEGISAELLHFEDSVATIETGLKVALKKYDVLLLSGGVSRGKFDHLPHVLENLGVEKLFHRVKQRPGKPFWFGKHVLSQTTLFAFPGNPGSTFANFHVYFLPWLYKSLGLSTQNHKVLLKESFENETELTQFVRSKTDLVDGKIYANLVMGNGSGDLTSLSESNGFVLVEPLQKYKEGEKVLFFPTKRIV